MLIDGTLNETNTYIIFFVRLDTEGLSVDLQIFVLMFLYGRVDRLRDRQRVRFNNILLEQPLSVSRRLWLQ